MTPRCPALGSAARGWAATAALLALAPLSAAAVVPAHTEAALHAFLAAPERVNVRGRMVVIHPTAQGAMQTGSRRVVAASDGRSLTVSGPPGGAPASVTMDAPPWTRAYEPAAGIVKVKRSVPRPEGAASLERRARLIRRNYAVSLRGRSAVAGRECYVLRFVPRHHGARLLQVWVDMRNGAELGREESDWQGETVALSMFTSVEFPSTIGDSELTYRIPRSARIVDISRSAMKRDPEELRRATGVSATVPLLMPAGYQLECCALTQINGARTVVMRYTDGLAVMTVCQQAAPPGCVAGTRTVYHWPKGEGMVQYVAGRTLFMVIGHAEPIALFSAADALDAARERAVIRRIARESGIPTTTLHSLRTRGYGLQELVALADVLVRRHATLDHVTRLLESGGDWRDVAERFGLSEDRVNASVSAILAGSGGR